MPFHRRAFCTLVLLSSLSACATPTPLASPDATRPTQFSSERISVTVIGQGPDIVLIPGLSSSPRAFDLLTKAMPDHRFHLVQVKGFAGTEAQGNAQGPVVEPVGEEIARYISSQNLTKPAVIGHSLGGTWAMLVATRHANLVGRVMIVDTMPFVGAMFGGPGTTPASVAPIALNIKDQMIRATDTQRRASIEAAVTGMMNSTERRGEVLADSLASDPNVSAQAYYDMVTLDLTEGLSAFGGPFDVLYVTPKGAPLSDAQMDAIYAGIYAAAPNRVVKRMPNSAHFIMFDQPAVFETEVRRFLTRD
jgi:pimeloyl-ACP methyl ester carboxylesterase